MREWLDEELKDPEFKRLYEEASSKRHVAMKGRDARKRLEAPGGSAPRFRAGRRRR